MGTAFGMRAPGFWFCFGDPAMDVFERIAAEGQIVLDEALRRQVLAWDGA
jgi:hypothetical protein